MRLTISHPRVYVQCMFKVARNKESLMKHDGYSSPPKRGHSRGSALAEPEKHWQSGFSAMSTALSWEDADSVPKEIASLFAHMEESAMRDASLVLAIPGARLNSLGAHMQNDVFAVLTCSGGLTGTSWLRGKPRKISTSCTGDWKKRIAAGRGGETRPDITEHIGLSTQIPMGIDTNCYTGQHRRLSKQDVFTLPSAAMIVQSVRIR